ncbi:dihydrofolate reductase [Candidatus Heimdallarchaeota archaeon B3_Heim]|nr:MAG: dihydrofolate reductase [Candidatus Heimdallarchaeota archaeon B3_Heim]
MKILITAPFDESGLQVLRESRDLKILYENWRETGTIYLDEEELIEKLVSNNIDIFITEGDEVDTAVIEKSGLKLIGVTRGNPVNVDLAKAQKKNIPVIYTPFRNADAVADLTVAMMLSQVRKMTEIDRFLRSGNFDVSDLDDDGFANFFNRFIGLEVGGLTIGIIGFGQIGQRVAKRLYHGFGSNLLYFDPYIPNDHTVVLETKARQVTLEILMKESDLITIHTPPVEETEEMIDEKMFNLMKPTAYFFNLARSFCIDEDALYDALKNKRIAGAGLDVFDDEPVDSENRFLQFDNVTVMPHFGGNTKDVIRHQTNMIVTDVLNFINNRTLQYKWKG